MANIVFPNRTNLVDFVSILQEREYLVSKHLPPINEEWYELMLDCVNYVKGTSFYVNNQSVHDFGSKLMYKIAKRHELGDGNKRSSVICVYLFYLLNKYWVKSPDSLKVLAKRIAKTKGRKNEDIVQKRIAEALGRFVVKLP